MTRRQHSPSRPLRLLIGWPACAGLQTVDQLCHRPEGRRSLGGAQWFPNGFANQTPIDELPYQAEWPRSRRRRPLEWRGRCRVAG
jgi:hypothetical protein